MAAASRGMVRFVWIRPPSGMGQECKRRAEAMEPELLGRMGPLKDRVINYAKSNAPWKDRTTNARNSIDGSANITAKGGGR